MIIKVSDKISNIRIVSYIQVEKCVCDIKTRDQNIIINDIIFNMGLQESTSTKESNNTSIVSDYTLLNIKFNKEP